MLDSKSVITFKRFELATRYKYVRACLVETHLSGKFEPDRSKKISKKFLGSGPKKNMLKKNNGVYTCFFSSDFIITILGILKCTLRND